MRLRNLIKGLVPPALLEAYKNFFMHQKIYSSYKDALKDSSSSQGYQDPYLVRAIVEETREYKISLENDLPIETDPTLVNILIPFASLPVKEKINVLDVGGASGIHYFSVKKMLKCKFNWSVVETEALSIASKELENDELKFFPNIKEAQKYLDKVDIVVSSGALQYMEDPLSSLKEILNTNARYILITRLSLSKTSSDVITVQKSMLSRNSFEKLPSGFKDRVIMYPHTNMCEALFLETIKEKYQIRIKIQDTSGLLKVNYLPVAGYGVLLEKL